MPCHRPGYEAPTALVHNTTSRCLVLHNGVAATIDTTTVAPLHRWRSSTVSFVFCKKLQHHLISVLLRA